MNYLFKIITFYFSLAAFFSRKIFVKQIAKNDLVLDVGSGDKPFWRADVIVDKFLSDDQQRHSGAMQFDKRKIFIEADVEKLPFKDKSFDFVFCSHLLEHVENPDKAIAEITRVGKKGYIEVPNGIVDLLKPFPPHLWFIRLEKDTFIFQQKSRTKNIFLEMTEKFGSKFYDLPMMQYLLAKYYKSIFITHYWQNKVKVKVARVEDPYVYVYKEELHIKNLFTKVSFILYKIFYAVITGLFYSKKKIDINELLIKSS